MRLPKNGWLAGALTLAMLVAGACTRAPGNVQRSPAAPIAPAARAETRDLNSEVASTAASISGAGRTEAIVMGNVALVALNVGGEPPGGYTTTNPAASQSTTPGTAAPGTAGTTAPGATGAATPGVAVARPGGGIAPGPVLPGGSPGSTTVTPGTTMAPAGAGGAVAPLNTNQDLQGRVATAINERFPFIAEVRFTGTGAQSDSLSRILSDMRAGQPITRRLPELAALAAVMQPTSNMLTTMPGGLPPSGTTGTTGTSPATVPGTSAPGTKAPGTTAPVPGGTTAPASPKGR